MIPTFDLFQPTSVDDALELMDRYGPDSWVLAGGLDSMDWFKDRIKRPAAVIEIGGIAELEGIRTVGNGLEIGAAATLHDVATSADVRDRFGLLAEAAEHHVRGEGFLDDEFLGRGTRTASFATLETPSDCAVPERFTFRFDRRLTAGETPQQSVSDIDSLSAVAKARADGLQVDVRVPIYDQLTWTGHSPGNPQVYPGWATPEDHPAIQTAEEAYRRVVSPAIDTDSEAGGGALRREPRVSRWVFSTDGVGVPVATGDEALQVPPAKQWVEAGAFRHPAMFGFGPGHEENTHKIGECVDSREIPLVVALYARFPSLYRQRVTS